MIKELDTTNMCSHLKRKLFEEDGEYHKIWLAIQDDGELTAVVRSRQLHIYRNGKKIMAAADIRIPGVHQRQEARHGVLADKRLGCCGLLRFGKLRKGPTAIRQNV